MKKIILVKCIVGSHLYGFNGPNSDIDYYEVYDFPYTYRPKKLAAQSIDDFEDKTSVFIDRYESFVGKGVPQSLELLFADEAFYLFNSPQWKSHREYLIDNLNIQNILETYKRTVVNFIKSDNEKKNRHAFRLCINAGELISLGKMQPSLALETVKKINNICKLPYEFRLDCLRREYMHVFDDVD